MKPAILLLTLAAATPAAVHAGEKRVSEKGMPAPVLAAFHAAYPAAAILALAVETERGRTSYEIESLDGRTRRDLSYAADGTLQEIEEGIPESQLPAPVQAAVKASYPGAKVLKAEKDTRGATVTYELHLKGGEAPREAVFAADGKALRPARN